jgi:hypothetical protein
MDIQDPPWLQKIKPHARSGKQLELSCDVFWSAHRLEKSSDAADVDTAKQQIKKIQGDGEHLLSRAAFALREFKLILPGMKQQERQYDYPNIFELREAFFSEYHNHNPDSSIEDEDKEEEVEDKEEEGGGGGGGVAGGAEGAAAICIICMPLSRAGAYVFPDSEFEAAIGDKAAARHAYIDCLEAALKMCDQMYTRAGDAHDYDEAKSIWSAEQAMRRVIEGLERPMSKADIKVRLNLTRQEWQRKHTDIESQIKSAKDDAVRRSKLLLDLQKEAFVQRQFAIANERKKEQEVAMLEGERAVKRLQVRFTADE